MPPRSFLLGPSWEQQGGVHTPSGQSPLLPVTGIQLYGTRVNWGGGGGIGFWEASEYNLRGKGQLEPVGTPRLPGCSCCLGMPTLPDSQRQRTPALGAPLS